MQILPFIKDEYKKARGGRSQFLDIYCDRCGQYVALYQKDGPGPLKRMYIDRFFKPESILACADEKRVAGLPAFECPSCKEELGIAFLYAKENRLAYKLFQSTVKTKRNTVFKQFLTPDLS